MNFKKTFFTAAILAAMVLFNDWYKKDKQEQKSRVELEQKKDRRAANLRGIADGYKKLEKNSAVPTWEVARNQDLCYLIGLTREYERLDTELKMIEPYPNREELDRYDIVTRHTILYANLDDKIRKKVEEMVARRELVGHCEDKDPIDFFWILEVNYLTEVDKDKVRRYFKKLLRSEVVKVKEAARREFVSGEEDWDNMPNRKRLCKLAEKAVKEWDFTLKEVGIERHLLDGKAY